jgi:hypothetical protein
MFGLVISPFGVAEILHQGFLAAEVEHRVVAEPPDDVAQHPLVAPEGDGVDEAVCYPDKFLVLVVDSRDVDGEFVVPLDFGHGCSPRNRIGISVNDTHNCGAIP